MSRRRVGRRSKSIYAVTPATAGMRLERVRGAGARAVVLELSSVRFMDRAEFDGLRALVGMLRLLGARTVLVGLRPGVVAWLVGSDVDLRGLEFERDLEGALERLGADGPDGEAPR